jgi:TrmH family RNA methyltransferase
MITSTANQRVKWIRMLQSRRSARVDEGVFIIEGKRLLQEALNANAQVTLVLHEEAPDEETLAILDAISIIGAELVPASENVLAACSDTETSQGLIAVAPVPQLSDQPMSDPLLIIDRIRDPGNLGTLMRTALAAGAGLMLLTPGTVDALNPKVVRGAMGAHFHLPFKTIEINELDKYLHGFTLWIAEARKGLRYDSVDWTQPTALWIGSEAHGPSDVALEFDHQFVHIPISKLSESLNAAVAGSILLFELKRQRGFT